MSKRLLLWDIDATLITTGGAGIDAMKRIVRERFGVDDDFNDIEIAGRTDVGIARTVLQKYAIEPNESNVANFLEQYIALLPQFLAQNEGYVLAGVRDILERLHGNPDRVLALLTGNLERGARLKLQYYGLADFFEFGAFADDHYDRNELGSFARRRAREKHGHDFEVALIDVIGDTGHDIACGKIFGARSIAVATGSWTREQLSAQSPDFLFDDFSDVSHVIETLGW